MNPSNQAVALPPRRRFLKASATLAGGLAVGFWLPGAQRAQAAGSLHTPNAWVHIADDNTITLISNQSEMGQGVYTALPMLLAEELDVDVRRVKVAIAPPGAVYVNPVLHAQLTGGSSSVRGMYEPLRLAGAQVRQMLLTAAAARWNVDRSLLKTDNAVVTGPGGRRATFGQLAQAASQLPVPQDAQPKDPKDFKLVGKPTRRLDTPAKVNGTAVFGVDVRLPGMVYAAIEMCPVVGGSVRSFDGSGAKAQRGVIDVVSTGDGVAVVADSWWRAKKAREALRIVWDEGPSAKVSTASMRETFQRALDAGTPIEIAKPVGDVDAAMARAAKVHRVEYWSQSLAHATLEPMNFTASYRDGKIRLIGPTQFQQAAQGAVAAALKLKPEDVSVETTFLGGGFGRRIEVDFIVQAALVSRAVERPVKLLWTREDDMTHDFYRPIAVNRIEVGLDADGMPLAWKYRASSQSIFVRVFGWDPKKLDPLMVEYAVTPYKLPNARYEVVHSDAGLRVGFWRSVSHPFNAFVNEGLIDELAALAGKDAVAYRLALLQEQPRAARVLELAAQKGGWGRPAPAGRVRGVAFMEGYEGLHAMVAELSVEGSAVRVHKVTVACDIGRMVNPDTVRAQIESSVAFGLGAALMQEVTFENGRAQQRNFDGFPMLRMHEHPPQIDITLVPSEEKPGGIGEPVTALMIAATANAVSAATGRRVRRLPITAQMLSA